MDAEKLKPFPYKNVITVIFLQSEDGKDGPPHYVWLQENVSPAGDSPPDVYYMVNDYQVTVYGAGDGWGASFPEHAQFARTGLRSLGKDIDIVGIDDDTIALQFALKFGT